MKVISGIGNVSQTFKNPVLAIGVFDGVHIGHQHLIKQAVQRAKEIHGQAIVMTFDPHPVHVLHPEIYLPLIVSVAYRLKLLEQLGVAACVVVRFTKKFSQLSPEKFIKKYIVDKVTAKEIFVGDDFRFGQNRSGTLEYFQTAGKKYGFKLNALCPIKAQVRKIGSTQIRQLIADGELKRAEKYLGRPVSIMDVVKKGQGRGKGIGFPTANLYPVNKMIPPIGVYAVEILVKNKKYHGMANVGVRPSFPTGKTPSANVEVHVFNFTEDLYQREITVSFIKKIRDEKKFPSISALSRQLRRDEVRARKILQTR